MTTIDYRPAYLAAADALCANCGTVSQVGDTLPVVAAEERLDDWLDDDTGVCGECPECGALASVECFLTVEGLERILARRVDVVRA
jgi:hypothetical protein